MTRIKRLSRELREQKFLDDAKNLHLDKYDYSLVTGTFKNVDTKVSIICNRCNKIFQQTPYNHLKGSGCFSCNISATVRATKDEFIIKAQEKHGIAYDYTDAEYKGCDNPITIKCNTCNNNFVTTPYSHVNGKRCSYCYTPWKHIDRKEYFIQQAKKTHGDKYSYNKLPDSFENVYLKTKLDIFCNNCQEYFSQSWNNHLTGYGCKKCARIRNKLAICISESEFLRRAAKKHGNKFEYVYDKFISVHDAIEIKCIKHNHQFKKIPDLHLNSTHGGCTLCVSDSMKFRLKSTEQYIKEITVVHGNKYGYDNVIYSGNCNKIEIICRKHGVFWQSAGSHAAGNGCPDCADTNSSKVENEWLDSINILKENRQLKLQGLGNRRVDGYDPETKTVYQFHGDYWHGNPALYSNDRVNTRNGRTFGELYQDTVKADQQIINAGYKLITMWELDWSKIKKDIKRSKKK